MRYYDNTKALQLAEYPKNIDTAQILEKNGNHSWSAVLTVWRRVGGHLGRVEDKPPKRLKEKRQASQGVRSKLKTWDAPAPVYFDPKIGVERNIGQGSNSVFFSFRDARLVGGRK